MFSKIVRRTHMYLALFLVPWVLMYALSTMAMNHRHFFDAYYNHEPAAWETEREMAYPAVFSDNVERWMVAEQILTDLGLEGNHNVRGRLDRGNLTITRQDPVTPRRITYDPEAKTLKIERQAFRTSSFLEHMHRRRGYDHGFVADTLWAVTVDLFILATVVWVASGLWMWWELKVTRKWGAICFASGIALFTFFLFTI